MQARGLAAAVCVSLIGAGFSAQALGPAASSVETDAPRATGYEAEDHFPGAALYSAAEDGAAAVAGSTGTAALPDMPVPANAVIDGTIQPARPFHLAGTALDKARALQCLTTAIYYEAATEPDDGQRAVAQVILNRVRHPAFPATVCGVVFQGSEKRGCQFSFACDGAMQRGVPGREAWARASRAASAALGGSVFAPVGMATHYHTYAVTPAWNRGLVMTGAFGAHFFHRWKGWWGTAAAFGQAYRGGEPLPMPHASIEPQIAVLPVPAAQSAPVVATVANAPSVAAQPEAIASPTLPESQILDRWKDSGKPLR